MKVGIQTGKDQVLLNNIRSINQILDEVVEINPLIYIILAAMDPDSNVPGLLIFTRGKVDLS